MSQNLLTKAFSIFDNFIINENNTNGTTYHRDPKSFFKDVMFKDKSLNPNEMIISIGVEKVNSKDTIIIFYYEKNYLSIAQKLEKEFTNNGIDSIPHLFTL